MQNTLSCRRVRWSSGPIIPDMSDIWGIHCCRLPAFVLSHAFDTVGLIHFTHLLKSRQPTHPRLAELVLLWTAGISIQTWVNYWSGRQKHDSSNADNNNLATLECSCYELLCLCSILLLIPDKLCIFLFCYTLLLKWKKHHHQQVERSLLDLIISTNQSWQP